MYNDWIVLGDRRRNWDEVLQNLEEWKADMLLIFLQPARELLYMDGTLTGICYKAIVDEWHAAAPIIHEKS